MEDFLILFFIIYSIVLIIFLRSIWKDFKFWTVLSSYHGESTYSRNFTNFKYWFVNQYIAWHRAKSTLNKIYILFKELASQLSFILIAICISLIIYIPCFIIPEGIRISDKRKQLIEDHCQSGCQECLYNIRYLYRLNKQGEFEKIIVSKRLEKFCDSLTKQLEQITE